METAQSCIRQSSDWISGEGSSLKGWSVTTASHLAGFKEHRADAPDHGLALGNPVRSREFDLMVLMGPSQLEIFCNTSSSTKFIKMDNAKDKIPLSRNRDALNHTIYRCSTGQSGKIQRLGKFCCGFSVFQYFLVLSPDLLCILCTQDTTPKLVYGHLYCAEPFYCAVSHIKPKLFSSCVLIAS